MLKKIFRTANEAFIRFYYDSRLKYKIMASFIVFTLILVLALGFFSRYIMQYYMQDYEKKLLAQNMNQLNNAIDSFFEIYMSKSDLLFDNLDLQKVLTGRNNSLYDVMVSHSKIMKISNQFLSDFRYPFMKGNYYFGGSIKAVWYIDNDSLGSDGQDIMQYDSIKDQKWCRELTGSENLMFSWQSEEVYNGKEYVIMSRKLKDFGSNRTIGILRVYIPVARIQNIISSSIQRSDYDFLYIDKANVVVYTGNLFGDNLQLIRRIGSMKIQKGIGAINLDSGKYLGGYLESNITGWRLVYLTPYSSITDKTKYMNMITIAAMLLSIVFCMLIASFVASFVTKRIGILVDKTNRISGGNMSIDTRIKGNDEIGQLDRNFNSMMKRINDLIEIEYKSEIILHRTRLELLQEQFNPHLLYNTLSVISFSSKRRNQFDIMNLTDDLIAFYKGVLNSGRMISSIRAEIDTAKRYCGIMKQVYNIDAEIEFDIDADIMDYYSIKLFLQPILENSIVHGIRPVKAGMIVVSSKVGDNYIQFNISDNGAGMDEEKLAVLRSMNGSSEYKGYGLSNVINRINMFFGEGYGVDIKSKTGEGTAVAVTIPKLTRDEINELLERKSLL